jgi:hypothetical protein
MLCTDAPPFVLCHAVLPCRGEAELSGSWVKFLVLGLALLFLGKQDTVEPTLEVCWMEGMGVAHEGQRDTLLEHNKKCVGGPESWKCAVPGQAGYREPELEVCRGRDGGKGQKVTSCAVTSCALCNVWANWILAGASCHWSRCSLCPDRNPLCSKPLAPCLCRAFKARSMQTHGLPPVGVLPCANMPSGSPH